MINLYICKMVFLHFGIEITEYCIIHLSERLLVDLSYWVDYIRIRMASKQDKLICRRATHAGSWYQADTRSLDKELTQWLNQAPLTHSPVRAIISPYPHNTLHSCINIRC